MRILNIIFVVMALTVSFSPFAVAQDKVLHGRRWFTSRQENRKSGQHTETIPATVSLKRDVSYLADCNSQHQLDVYTPVKGEKPFPVLVHIHGGGWKMGDKEQMRNTGIFYASHGILFITPNYRLSPEVTHPAHVQDCAAALSWVFDHVATLGGDPERIFLSGHSAGAHLAALLATNTVYLQKYALNPSQLAGVIPVDTASFNLLANNNERLVKRFVKQAFGRKKEVLVDASPLFNITDKGECPEFLVLNTMNRAAGVKGGKVFAEKLKNAGCKVQFIPVADHTHRDMAQGMYDATDPVGKTILEFILRK